EQTDMSLLDEIAHRQAEMAELRGHRDDEPHMRGGDAVQRLLVVLLLPADREVTFFLALEIGSPHGSFYQGPVEGFVNHAALLLPGTPPAKPTPRPAQHSRSAQKSQTFQRRKMFQGRRVGART